MENQTPEKNTTDEQKRAERKKELIEWVKTIALAVAVAMLIRTFLFQVVVIHQTSMYPTFVEGQRAGVVKCAFWFDEPSRGDVVIINIAPHKRYIKRVIAAGGETIEVRDNVVYLNGEELEESYLVEGIEYPFDYPETTIPEGCYFVMGDNRRDSIDSRYESIGMIEENRIIGKVAFRFVPFTMFW